MPSSLPTIIFFGTPHFAVTVAEALRQAGYPIAAVVTQPDQVAGRKRELTSPPVKAWAAERRIPVFQPRTLTDALAAELSRLSPDIFIVAAYGVIFPVSFLSRTRYGALNVHASLLPKYRGASPISAAIAAGETETGVTIMRMDPGLDTGPIITQADCPITPDDTCASLSDKLATVGATELVRMLPAYVSGKLPLLQQNHTQATHTKILDKKNGQIDWTCPAAQIEQHIRAMWPWPAAWTMWQGEQIKIKKARVLQPAVSCATATTPGATFTTAEGYLAVTCGTGSLLIEEAQRPGKKMMDTKEILRGMPEMGNGNFSR